MHFLQAVDLCPRARMLLPGGKAAWQMKWARAGVRAMGGRAGRGGLLQVPRPWVSSLMPALALRA